MSYKIKINKEEKIIEVHSFGIETSESLLDQVDEIVHLSKKENVFNVLIDTINQEKFSSLACVFRFMSTLPIYLNYAIYLKNGQQTFDEIEFGAMVSNNRGINVKKFKSRVKAIQHLKRNQHLNKLQLA